jgi:ABC-type uncharacterized transport system involved in gliding motility auxiliary subunit
MLKSRQTRYAAYAGTYILVIIAVLGAVNFLANRYDKSFDTTANKQFSLSDQTIKVVKNLNRDIQIKYFDETQRFPAARDLLDRYSSLSPKVRVDFIDPVKKPQQALAAGFRRGGTIPNIIVNGLRPEEAKSLTEEELTGALIRSLKSGERNACVVSAAGEPSLDDTGPNGFGYVKQLLERNNYKPRTVKLSAGAAPTDQPVTLGKAVGTEAVAVPKDCTTLIVAGPRLDYTPATVNALKNFMEAGGHGLFMLDNTLTVGRDEPASENAGLAQLLADWGVTVNKDLILDLSGEGARFGLEPFVPVIVAYEQHPIVRPLDGEPTAFSMARSLDIKAGGKTTVEKLFGTTSDSFSINAVTKVIDPKKGKKGPLAMAAAGTYAGATQGRFIVVGTSQWARNSFLPARPLGNRDLFMNMINWLTSDEDLISIRPKSPEDRPLTITSQKLNLLFWLSVIIFPLGVVGFGLATWWKRR